MIRNKARVEGSICESWLLQEASSFISMYDKNKKKKKDRHDDGGEIQLMTGCLYGDVLAEVLGHIDQYIGQKGVISTMPICVLSTTHQKPNSSRCELEVKFIFIQDMTFIQATN